MVKFFADLKDSAALTIKTDGAYSGYHLTMADEKGNVIELVMSVKMRDEFIERIREDHTDALLARALKPRE